MHKEKLTFAVALSGTFWDRKPQFSIWLDDHVVVQSEIANQAQQIVNFEHTIEEGPHTLKIRLENKTDNDTIIENDTVIKDMLLNIDDIVIDNISLENLLWSAEYILDQPQRYRGESIDHLDGCINLGWNGTYVLKFTSPFYIWLLEKL